jgi:hypothetical protein
VAFTRPRSGLIVIGHADTLARDHETWGRWLNWVSAHGVNTRDPVPRAHLDRAALQVLSISPHTTTVALHAAIYVLNTILCVLNTIVCVCSYTRALSRSLRLQAAAPSLRILPPKTSEFSDYSNGGAAGAAGAGGGWQHQHQHQHQHLQQQQQQQQFGNSMSSGPAHNGGGARVGQVRFEGVRGIELWCMRPSATSV